MVNWRQITRSLVFGAMFWMLALGTLPAAGAEDKVPATQVVRIAAGLPLTSENAARARESLISTALTRAVSQVAVDLIPVDSLVLRFEALMKMLYSSAENYVQSYKVLAESETDTHYRALVETVVASRSLKQSLAAAGFLAAKENKPRVLICIAEQNADQDTPIFWWRPGAQALVTTSGNAIAASLDANGYFTIRDRAAADDMLLAALQDTVTLGDNEAVELGRQLGADVVLVGSATANAAQKASGSDLTTFRANVDVRALKVSTGMQLNTVSHSSISVNTDAAAGGKSALTAAAARAGDDLARQLTSGWQANDSKAKTVTLSVTGTGNLSAFIGLRRVLSQIPGVERFQITSLKADQAELTVLSKTGPQGIADALTQKADLSFGVQIVEIAADALVLSLTAAE